MDQRQLAEQEERYEFTASVLREASIRPLTSAEVLFLASELGINVNVIIYQEAA